MDEHTPTPWRVNGSSIWADDGYVADLSCPRGPDKRDADAAFIVQAVNNHDALVKALEKIAAFANYKEGTGGFLGPRLSGMASAGDIARDALAAVGGAKL